ncbi:MAG: adenylate/guanylate cyclase domain-containing protein [Myxococcales bacterium]|nr:adenylate/guanylate cyclase domain-containing protein [Myxococcales bacterium]
MKTANLAIVFTDIKGFTERTGGQTLEENQRSLATHNALLGPLFKAFGGRVVKMIGDAFLVTFESPTSAVLAGVAIQDKLWQHNRGVPEGQRLDVRVAINVGEVRIEDGDVFGEPVNIAARVEGIAEAGEVTFTEAVHLAMNRAEVPAEVVGEFELKGIRGKVKVYKVPRAPWRLEASEAAPADVVTSAADPVQPPFGNIALAKLKDDPYAPSSLLAPELTQKAGELATQAASFASSAASKAVTMMTSNRAALGWSKAQLGGSIGVALVLVLGLWLLLQGNAIERAIRDVANASSEQRSAAEKTARGLIDKEKDAAKRQFYLGELAVASDDGSAVGYYRAAARAGSSRAEDRLVKLLSHPKCSWRSAAASTVGDLKLTAAKRALKRLAENGGDDDGEQVLFMGCNSKAAAQGALRQLER